MSMRYLALQPVWHSKEQKQFEPGESLDLEHLLPEQIQSLIDAGVVMPEEDGMGILRPEARLRAEEQLAADAQAFEAPPTPSHPDLVALKNVEASARRHKRAQSKSEGE